MDRGTVKINPVTSPIATQAEQEAGTSLKAVVTPGRQHNHQSACKAWAKFDTAGTVVAGYNVDSVTDNGTSNFAPVWGTDFSSEHYSFQVSYIQSAIHNQSPQVSSVTAGGMAGVGVINSTPARTEADVTHFAIAAWGDQ